LKIEDRQKGAMLAKDLAFSIFDPLSPIFDLVYFFRALPSAVDTTVKTAL